MTELHLQRKRKKRRAPWTERPSPTEPQNGDPPDGLPPAVLCGFLRLVMNQRGLVEDLEDLGQRRLLVSLLHRSELARQARRSSLENLPLRIALLGRIVGPEQVADDLGDRGQVARVDLRLIF